MCGENLTTPFKPPRRCCEARAGLFTFEGRSRKQFSPLGRSFEARAGLFMCGKDLITTLNACLSGREDPESSFHHCGGPVRLVKTCLCAGKT